MKASMARAIAAAACVLLAGCEREMHNMYRQPRYDPDEPSSLFADGRATRPPPPGSVPVAIGEPAMTSSGRRGERQVESVSAALAAASAPPLTAARLERGRERYAIYCVPCHSPVGDGDGPVVRRGFPRPPSYHEERLRQAPDRHFFDVITHGYGVMYSYADRVTPDDRWAIVAYIRALQLSQHAEFARLPRSLQAQLAPAAAASGATR
ncbi:MAG: c-type cytochrome [Rhizobacter sp.]